MAGFLTVDMLRAHAAPLDACLSQAVPLAPTASALVMHDIPGRIRLVVPALRHDEHRLGALGMRLQRLGGVQSMRFDQLTGSLVVLYDGSVCPRDAIFRALLETGCVVARRQAGTTCGMAWRALVHCALDLVLDAAITAIA